MNFTPKRSAEVEIFTVDYANNLALGETIASAVWTVTVVQGADANSASMIHGVASISGTKVSQMIAAGVPGVTYAPVCTATTSLGQTLVLPEYAMGLLEVTL